MNEIFKPILLNMVLITGFAGSVGLSYADNYDSDVGKSSTAKAKSSYVSSVSADQLSSNVAVADDDRSSNCDGGCGGNCPACGRCYQND